jgi:hypothetical protein
LSGGLFHDKYILKGPPGVGTLRGADRHECSGSGQEKKKHTEFS